MMCMHAQAHKCPMPGMAHTSLPVSISASPHPSTISSPEHLRTRLHCHCHRRACCMRLLSCHSHTPCCPCNHPVRTHVPCSPRTVPCSPSTRDPPGCSSPCWTPAAQRARWGAGRGEGVDGRGKGEWRGVKLSWYWVPPTWWCRGGEGGRWGGG